MRLGIIARPPKAPKNFLGPVPEEMNLEVTRNSVLLEQSLNSDASGGCCS